MVAFSLFILFIICIQIQYSSSFQLASSRNHNVGNPLKMIFGTKKKAAVGGKVDALDY